MRQLLEIPGADLVPDREKVLAAQGIPTRADTGRIRELLDGAFAAYVEEVAARALYQAVDAATFARVYRGEGQNEDETPVAEVSPRAEGLALFAVTLGQGVSDAISRLFAGRELAEAAMLDAVASEGADLAVIRVGGHFLDALRGRGEVSDEAVVLTYSPGYCGWHISGQQALFDVLGPHAIGLTVSSSHLMQPLKSVSGVLVAAPPAAHDFDDSFDFCARCSDRGCRARLAAIGR
jgi:hypothetical protein